MNILRTYKPHECDLITGDPLDWERCRSCGGTGRSRDPRYWGTMPGSIACPGPCSGYCSLEAAALAELTSEPMSCAERVWDGPYKMSCGYLIVNGKCVRHGATTNVTRGDLDPRCEGCAHPMSEGTWVDDPSRTRVESEAELQASYLANAERILREGREPSALDYVHFSSCDEKCDHGGRGRCGTLIGWELRESRPEDHDFAKWKWQASWRQVAVRRGVVGAKGLGKRFDLSNALHVRPFDLSPENVGLYCTRCWYEMMR